MKPIPVLIASILFFSAVTGYCATGCDLNDPDRDVKRLFPESTGYKTVYLSIDKKGGTKLLEKIESRLGDKFRGLYETADVPYTLYEIYKTTEKIGYIHGVNQKGKYGGIQVFMSFDLDGNIKSLYFQKLTSKSAKKFRDKKFTGQFIGLNLRDFYGYDVVTGKTGDSNKIASIQNPVPDNPDDYLAALRGAKKNLILMDEFVYENKHLHKTK
jgi:hypothetical protein